MGLAFGVLAALLLVAPVLMVLSARAPVSRARVERFARRQRLRITPDNGNQVIAYLATTRRWRVAGLLTAYGLALGWGVQAAFHDDEGSIGLLQLLSGWFIGAIIAEARLVRRPAGERRAASLRPREPSAYLSPPARVVLPAALVASLAVAVVTLVAAAVGLGPDGLAAVVGLAAAATVSAIVQVVRRRVLDRPQPVAPPDQVEADDAIRSRSLHVLAAAGAVLVLYAVAHQLRALSLAFPGAEAGFLAVLLVLNVGAPVLGWIVATRPWSASPGRLPESPSPAAPSAELG